MIALHAPDAMGKAAHTAAQFASLLDFRLLCAASPTMTREQRAEALRKALEQWPKVCRAMAVLEQVAPTATESAATADATGQDYVQMRDLMARQHGEAKR